MKDDGCRTKGARREVKDEGLWMLVNNFWPFVYCIFHLVGLSDENRLLKFNFI